MRWIPAVSCRLSQNIFATNPPSPDHEVIGSSHTQFPPSIYPIPPETALEQKNYPATVTDPALIEQIVLHAPDSVWRRDIVHGIKRTGWAGAWLIIFFLLFLAYGNLPNRWYHILYVYSGSMSPAINPGDLIIITPPTKVLEPGMILTMRVDGKLVTHRLLGISSDGLVITKGDANKTLDSWDQGKLEIGGIVRGRIPYLGYMSQIGGVFNQKATGGWYVDAHQINLDLTSGKWVLEPTDHTRAVRHIDHSQRDRRWSLHSI